jgi:hypothetical protein
MRLTVEEHREAIRRYGHIRPARRGKRRCAARLMGTRRSCTLEKEHSGAHVAHGAFGRVLAVWDGGSVPPTTEVRVRGSRASALSRQDLGKGGLIQALKDLGGRVVRHPGHFLEEAAFLIFFLAMVVFVIDWTLRMLGIR